MLNQFKTVALLGVLSALLVGVGSAVAPGHLVLFVGLALVMNLGAYFFSDRLVLRMHHAQEVDERAAPDLHAMVAELSQRAGIPKPRVYLIPEEQPNAFATGRNPKHGVVAVTAGLMRLLDRRELRGVIAHELAHIKNRDILVSSVAAVIVSVVSSVGQAPHLREPLRRRAAERRRGGGLALGWAAHGAPGAHRRHPRAAGHLALARVPSPTRRARASAEIPKRRWAPAAAALHRQEQGQGLRRDRHQGDVRRRRRRRRGEGELAEIVAS
jgi:Zn-dependent protease with chaperone function